MVDVQRDEFSEFVKSAIYGRHIGFLGTAQARSAVFIEILHVLIVYMNSRRLMCYFISDRDLKILPTIETLSKNLSGNTPI